MTSKFVNEEGTVRVRDSVIAQIASEAAMSSYGIVGLAFRNAKDGILTLLKKDNMSKGVRIESCDEGVTIHLDVVLEYGVRIGVVGENIIDTVKYRVEKLTGLKVLCINVYVQGIRV
ncbi:MAG: Asp23/Gls24 family envelope stress response protein [Tissierellia bacterium]|nr:Asp23/Gls24 family envelope stress response protein [Tissierellia bacterium]